MLSVARNPSVAESIHHNAAGIYTRDGGRWDIGAGHEDPPHGLGPVGSTTTTLLVRWPCCSATSTMRLLIGGSGAQPSGVKLGWLPPS
jgi:hypothetical protein